MRGVVVARELKQDARDVVLGLRRKAAQNIERLIEELGHGAQTTPPGALPQSAPVAQNALKVMIVRVSWIPGIVCTFSLTKCPISVPCST
jgi:hypothetical protein